jgi:hypothetical protein
VSIGTVVTSPIFSAQASLEKAAFGPIPSIGPLAENQSVVL